MITTDVKLQGASGNLSLYGVLGLYTAQVPIAGRDGKPAGMEHRTGQIAGAFRASGVFHLEFPDVEIVGSITFVVTYPNGATAATKEVPRDAVTKLVTIEVPVPSSPPMTANPKPDSGKHLKLTGSVVDTAGRVRPARMPVQIYAMPPGDDRGEQLVFAAVTDAHGNFSGDYPRATWTAAWAEVAGAPGVRVPVALQADRTLPRRVLVAVEIQNSKSADCGCGQPSAVPRQPAAEELVEAPETYSADKGGGCVTFAVPNRTIEEYLYTFIVRTTDPAIKGLVLEDEEAGYVPSRVVDDLLGVGRPPRELASTRASAPVAPSRTPPDAPPPASPPITPAAPRRLRLDVFRNLGGRLSAEAIGEAIDRSAKADALDRANAAGHRVPSRAPLGPGNPIDWDAEPTFYQATTIALGHLVHFKQVWKADGFSLGDLLYSLPLAPAQKKQIAIVDWERRESAARREDLLASEQLAADLSRDRDILEIVNTTVDETMKGASAALTGGGAKSKGNSSSSSEGSRVMGVSGGGGGAASGAIQDANRTLAVTALQQLHDRTVQAASGLRSQRSTVVQTVSQGESVRVETDTVANYNHCHAMTVEYFEVLRHFRVEHEVAAVSECLFVPLLMSPFSEAKALRWRTALQPRLLERRLAPAFDAVDRRLHQYEGSDLPEHRYADEEIEHLEGELTMEFSWVRPPDDDKGEFVEAAWKAVGPFLMAKGGPAAVFAAYLAKRAREERDRVFRETVVPLVIEGLVEKLRVRVGGSRLGGPGGFGGGGQFQDANMDASLISRPRAGVPLHVSLRLQGAPPSIARARVSAVTIDIPGMTTDATEARALIRTGSLRYRTAHREDFLFRNRRIDDDLAASDAVRIDTPLNREELRNPREEDKELSRRLVAHLNEQLEYYHRALWLGMDAGRRFMLLDGILAPGPIGRSVASVVENRIVAVVGNSLVMPVAPGFRLEPENSDADLLRLYAPTVPLPPVRLSLPTRGVFAEAVMGECNACEKIDDTRFWRWEESPIPGEPPAIAPVSADSRASAGPDLTAKDFAPPMINLQNAPSAPDPTGLGAALSVIGASNLFRDVTGLEGNQKNAAAALAGALGNSAAASAAATKAVERAADLQMQKQLSRDGDRILEKIETAHASGALDHEQRRQATGDFFRGVTGAGGGAAEPVTMQEFREVMAASGDSGVAASFNPDTGVFEVTPLQAPTKPVAGAAAASPLTAETPVSELTGDLDLNPWVWNVLPLRYDEWKIRDTFPKAKNTCREYSFREPTDGEANPDPSYYVFVPKSAIDASLTCKVFVYFHGNENFNSVSSPVIKYGLRKWASEAGWILVVAGITKKPKKKPRQLTYTRLRHLVLKAWAKAAADFLPASADEADEVTISTLRLGCSSFGIRSLADSVAGSGTSKTTLAPPAAAAPGIYTGGYPEVIDRVLLLDPESVPAEGKRIHDALAGIVERIFNYDIFTTPVHPDFHSFKKDFGINQTPQEKAEWVRCMAAICYTRLITDYRKYDLFDSGGGEDAPDIPSEVSRQLLDSDRNPCKPDAAAPSAGTVTFADGSMSYFPERGRFWSGFFPDDLPPENQLPAYYKAHLAQAERMIGVIKGGKIQKIRYLQGGLTGKAPWPEPEPDKLTTCTQTVPIGVVAFIVHPKPDDASNDFEYQLNGQTKAYAGNPDNDAGLIKGLLDFNFTSHRFCITEFAREMFLAP